jgi:hypothetical protein
VWAIVVAVVVAAVATVLTARRSVRDFADERFETGKADRFR